MLPWVTQKMRYTQTLLETVVYAEYNNAVNIQSSSRKAAHRVQPVNGFLNLVTLACKDTLVQLDQLQERLGRGVVVALLHLKEALGLRIDGSKRVWHELHHCSPDGLTAQLHIIQELLGHAAASGSSPIQSV